MIYLPEVTVICNTWMKYEETVRAINFTLTQITPREVVFVSPNLTIDGCRNVYAPKMTPEEHSKWCIKEYHTLFNTTHALNIHHDGYVLNGNCWQDEWLNLDMIGAKWLYTDGMNVGNTGFCLRSKKLWETIANADFITKFHPEDEVIGRDYRPILEKQYGIKYATEEQADMFSFEQVAPKQKTFGFHNYLHKPFEN